MHYSNSRFVLLSAQTTLFMKLSCITQVKTGLFDEENHHRRTACPATQSGPNWLELEKIPYTATKTQGS